VVAGGSSHAEVEQSGPGWWWSGQNRQPQIAAAGETTLRNSCPSAQAHLEFAGVAEAVARGEAKVPAAPLSRSKPSGRAGKSRR
jgi:hypothetical protein